MRWHTDDPEDGADGGAEEEEDDRDTDEDGLQLTGLVGVGSDPNTLWGDPVDKVHASDHKGHAEQQQEVCDPVYVVYDKERVVLVE